MAINYSKAQQWWKIAEKWEVKKSIININFLNDRVILKISS